MIHIEIYSIFFFLQRWQALGKEWISIILMGKNSQCLQFAGGRHGCRHNPEVRVAACFPLAPKSIVPSYHTWKYARPWIRLGSGDPSGDCATSSVVGSTLVGR